MKDTIYKFDEEFYSKLKAMKADGVENCAAHILADLSAHTTELEYEDDLEMIASAADSVQGFVETFLDSNILDNAILLKAIMLPLIDRPDPFDDETLRSAHYTIFSNMYEVVNDTACK